MGRWVVLGIPVATQVTVARMQAIVASLMGSIGPTEAAMQPTRGCLALLGCMNFCVVSSLLVSAQSSPVQPQPQPIIIHLFVRLVRSLVRSFVRPSDHTHTKFELDGAGWRDPQPCRRPEGAKAVQVRNNPKVAMGEIVDTYNTWLGMDGCMQVTFTDRLRGVP